MSDPHEKTADPGQIKAEILRAGGTEVADIPLEEALDPSTPTPGEDDDKPEAGDDDPSRDIQSAEQVMTFNGLLNGGSADLTPFIKKRLKEIAKNMGRSASKNGGGSG